MVKDSGERREFSSGALRDISVGKGRCDLLQDSWFRYFGSKPSEVRETSDMSVICQYVSAFLHSGYVPDLYTALDIFAHLAYAGDNYLSERAVMMLELSKRCEEGALKYGEYNWQKGMPAHVYIDSGIRHLLKYIAGQDDEEHDRAFVWNILSLLWTIENKPELNDLPYTKEQ